MTATTTINKAAAIRQVLNSPLVNEETPFDVILGALRETFPSVKHWDRSQINAELRIRFPNRKARTGPKKKEDAAPSHEEIQEIIRRIENLFLQFPSPDVFLEMLDEVSSLIESCGSSEGLRSWVLFLSEQRLKPKG